MSDDIREPDEIIEDLIRFTHYHEGAMDDHADEYRKLELEAERFILKARADTYKIVRFYRDEDPDHRFKVIKRGLTLEEAQAHCQDEATHGDGWFDGYDKDD